VCCSVTRMSCCYVLQCVSYHVAVCCSVFHIMLRCVAVSHVCLVAVCCSVFHISRVVCDAQQNKTNINVVTFGGARQSSTPLSQKKKRNEFCWQIWPTTVVNHCQIWSNLSNIIYSFTFLDNVIREGGGSPSIHACSCKGRKEGMRAQIFKGFCFTCG